MKNKCFEKMRNSLNQYASLTEENWNKLSEIFQISKYSKATHIVHPSEENSRLFFVYTGLIRYYYLGDDGQEWNKAFIHEDTLSASFSKDFLGQLSPYGIQALEDSVLLTARYSDFEALYETCPMIERLARKFIESVLISKMKRERSFLQCDTKMRYLDFLKQHPMLSQRIPQYHLASYLGVSEVSLSRIRRAVSLNS